MPRDGAMVSLMTDRVSVETALAPWSSDLAIAAVNGPRSVVVSGRRAPLGELVSAMGASGVTSVPLEVSHAFHSPSMDGMLDEFEAFVTTVDLHEPTLELLSNRTGQPAGPGLLTSPRYWREHVRQTVRFADSIGSAVAGGSRVFLEVGPSGTLAALARGGPVPADATFVVSCRARSDEARDVQRAVAALHCRGVVIDWPAYAGAGVRRPEGLPRYPFDRRRHWLPEVDARRHRPASPEPVEPLVPLHGTALRSPRLTGSAFSRHLTPSSPGWLSDHVVHEAVTFPATGYLELMGGAGGSVLGSPVDLVDVRIDEALVLDERPVEIQTLVTADGRSVEVHSSVGDDWRRHAIATLVEPATPPADQRREVDAAWARCRQPIEGGEYYAILERAGASYGPTFRCIETARRGDGEAVARLRAPDPSGPPGPSPTVHPGLADACLQVIGLAMPEATDLASAEHVYLPVAVARWQTGGEAVGPLTAHGTLDGGGGTSGDVLVGDVTLCDASGALVLGAYGVRFRRVARGTLSSHPADAEWFYTVRWEPAATPQVDAGPRPVTAAAGRWLVVGAAGGASASLIAALREAGVAADRLLPRDVVSHLAPSLAGVVYVADPGTPVPEAAASVAAIASAAAAVSLDLTVAVVTAASEAVVPGDVVEGHEQAALRGLARVGSSEQPDQRWRAIDVVDLSASAMGDVATELVAGEATDSQVAWRGGVRYVPRLVRVHEVDELPAPTGPYELQIVDRGRLDGLHLAELAPLEPGPGEGAHRCRRHGSTSGTSSTLWAPTPAMRPRSATSAPAPSPPWDRASRGWRSATP